ncbi:MAG: T9SS type A sorting domain-containing protein [Archaeoglobus sp.]|nr:T9SS type A sorting domain-containing protein [Archaeoglobus sp.]
MRFWSIVFSILLIASTGYTQNTWVKFIGGAKVDEGLDIKQCTDGGYIIVGGTSSFGKGPSDVYLIKTSSVGDTLWTRTYGGNDSDVGTCVQQTTDGGYIVTGFTQSYGDSSGDVYLLKIDSKGDTLWTRTFGGDRYDIGFSICPTTDNGYIIVGFTKSYGDGIGNAYIIKTDSMGDVVWTKMLEGLIAYSISQTSDGNYIIACSDNGDIHVYKIDSSGNTIWHRIYGANESYDVGKCIRQTADGGYIITGSTQLLESEQFVYLVRTTSSGDTIWTKRIGPEGGYSGGNSVQQTDDGGYIITGFSSPSYSSNSFYIYLVKTNPSGDTLWTKIFGGYDREDKGNSVQQTNDRGFVITGRMGNDICFIKTDYVGNITGINEGEKIDRFNPKSLRLFQNYPNPFNRSTTISYELLRENQEVQLIIYDLRGKEICKLIQKNQYKGIYNVTWDGKDQKGNEVSSGIYFCRLKTENINKYIKLVLIK